MRSEGKGWGGMLTHGHWTLRAEAGLNKQDEGEGDAENIARDVNVA